jgi:hypothetical protein
MPGGVHANLLRKSLFYIGLFESMSGATAGRNGRARQRIGESMSKAGNIFRAYSDRMGLVRR